MPITVVYRILNYLIAEITCTIRRVKTTNVYDMLERLFDLLICKT